MTKASPLISIIVPCYNAEKTIEWTVRSVLSQTYSNFELICIDDCSSDNTFGKLQDLALLDSRIKAYKNKKNSAQGITRNNGISYAQGEFIAFLDADDYYEPNFLESLCDISLENNADITQCAIRYIFNDRDYITGSPVGIIEGEHCSYRIDLNDSLPYLTPQVWNKLYKKYLFEGVEFKSIYLEDAEIWTSITKKCNKIVCIDNTHYHYNKRFSTLTGNVRREIERLPYFFDSIIQSIKPYFTDNFLSLIKKWGVRDPICSRANTANFLNTLVSTKHMYSSDELEKIQTIFNNFEVEFLSNIPDSYHSEFKRVFNSFRNRMNFIVPEKRRLSQHPIIRKLMLGIMERSFPLVDRLIPKKEDEWLFTTWARHPYHTLDNPRAVFEEVKNDKSIKKIVILNSNKIIEPDLENNVFFYPLHSLKAMYAMLRAGKIFTGYSLHAVFGYRRLVDVKHRRIIQLWHGIPIKKIGLAVSSNLEGHWPNECLRYDMTIANSVDDKKAMERSFFPDSPEKVKLTGLPRHDLMVMAEDNLPEDYKDDLSSIKSRLNGRKLVLFAPTWRYNNESPCAFDYEQLRELDEIFNKHNAVLGIRVHANMLRHHSGASFISDNIVYLNDYTDVNVIMRETDALITDYSSLYLDFMVQDRPVLLYTPDIENYKSNRGFNYTADDFVPHEFLIQDFTELSKRICSVLDGEHTLDAQYHHIKAKFHKFDADGNNAKRVLDCVK